jgi:hypothetical protein
MGKLVSYIRVKVVMQGCEVSWGLNSGLQGFMVSCDLCCNSREPVTLIKIQIINQSSQDDAIL